MKTNNAEPDTEFYILQGTKKKKLFYRKPLFWIIMAAMLLGIAFAIIVLFHPQDRQLQSQPEVENCESMESVECAEPVESYSYGNYTVKEIVEESAFDETVYRSEVLVNMKDVNGFSMRIYTLPEEDVSLQVGPVNSNDRFISLAVCAADINADNGKIEGTFVDKGELLSQGESRKGYCAIIRGKVYIGAAESTSYLEEVLNSNGCFFRQHPLVIDGMAIDNKLKGKSLRRALCEKDGKILVIECANISLHDFSRTLAEYGVENAICLASGDTYGFFRNKNNVRYDFGNPERNKEPNITYVICE